eukprot:gene5698-6886_t
MEAQSGARPQSPSGGSDEGRAAGTGRGTGGENKDPDPTVWDRAADTCGNSASLDSLSLTASLTLSVSPSCTPMHSASSPGHDGHWAEEGMLEVTPDSADSRMWRRHDHGEDATAALGEDRGEDDEDVGPRASSSAQGADSRRAWVETDSRRAWVETVGDPLWSPSNDERSEVAGLATERPPRGADVSGDWEGAATDEEGNRGADPGSPSQVELEAMAAIARARAEASRSPDTEEFTAAGGAAMSSEAAGPSDLDGHQGSVDRRLERGGSLQDPWQPPVRGLPSPDLVLSPELSELLGPVSSPVSPGSNTSHLVTTAPPGPSPRHATELPQARLCPIFSSRVESLLQLQ